MSDSFACNNACEEAKSSMNINDGPQSADAPSVNHINTIKSEALEASARVDVEIKEDPLEVKGECVRVSIGDYIEIKEEPLAITSEDLYVSTEDDIEIKEEPLETTDESQVKLEEPNSLKTESSNIEVCCNCNIVTRYLY